MSETKTLYDTDFFAWSKQQAEALRSAARDGSNRSLDWENLAEEIESLGKSQRRELSSQTRRIIHHLLTLQHSPATAPQTGWIASILDARSEIEVVIEDSPSLRNELRTIIVPESRRAARNAIADLAEYGEIDAALRARIEETRYTPEQVFGDWLPPSPSGRK